MIFLQIISSAFLLQLANSATANNLDYPIFPSTEIATINDCLNWYQPVGGEKCELIAQQYNTTVENLIKWNLYDNPTQSLNLKNCNLDRGVKYCVERAEIGEDVENENNTKSSTVSENFIAKQEPTTFREASMKLIPSKTVAGSLRMMPTASTLVRTMRKGAVKSSSSAIGSSAPSLSSGSNHLKNTFSRFTPAVAIPAASSSSEHLKNTFSLSTHAVAIPAASSSSEYLKNTFSRLTPAVAIPAASSSSEHFENTSKQSISQVKPASSSITDHSEKYFSKTTQAAAIPSSSTSIDRFENTSTQFTSASLASTMTKPAASSSTTNSRNFPKPTQRGLISTCNSFHEVRSGEYCYKLVKTYGNFTLDQFYQWNPAVMTDCSRLKVGFYVCIGVTGVTQTKKTTQTISSRPHKSVTKIPNPRQVGITMNCNKFHFVKPGQSCNQIIDANNLVENKFYAWNPAIGSKCERLFAGYDVCIGVSDSSLIPPKQPNSGEKATNKNPSNNKPLNDNNAIPPMPGVTHNCKQWHKVVEGDHCGILENKYNVSFEMLLRWNNKIGNNCETLWLGYNVCVGA